MLEKLNIKSLKLHLNQSIWTNLVPYQRLDTYRAIPDKTNNQLLGKEPRPLSSNINPLKKIGQIQRKEYALEETAEDELDLDVNIDGDNQEKSNSENVFNESQNIQENSSSL